MTLRVAIVDDESPARQLLREYLDGEPDVEVVAECANGFEAVKAVAEQRPDLLLLDVQMPKLDGFEVLELVGRDTSVIFTTRDYSNFYKAQSSRPKAQGPKSTHKVRTTKFKRVPCALCLVPCALCLYLAPGSLVVQARPGASPPAPPVLPPPQPQQ